MLSLRMEEHRGPPRAPVSANVTTACPASAGSARGRAGRSTGRTASGSRTREERRRISALAIPPPGRSLDLPRSRRAHQATARDARGRKQYRYHPLYRAARDRVEVPRMLGIQREILPDIRERGSTAADLRARPDAAADPRHRGAAAGQDADPGGQRRGTRARTGRSGSHPARTARGDRRLEAALHLPRQRAASATKWRSPIGGSRGSCSSARTARPGALPVPRRERAAARPSPRTT